MPRIRDAGDSALLLELEAAIDPAINARAVAIAAAVRRAAIPGVRDVVSTYRSVAVYFDPLVVDVRRLRDLLDRAAATPGEAAVGRTIEIPVLYGGEAGPDLPDVAAHAGMRADQVIERHAGAEYRVYMLGFLPGFAYLGAVDEVIAMPRRSAPRPDVPAGSVGIAGRQTGVYPSASPGGWRLVGRTPWRMFDTSRPRPSLLEAGDRVRFVPVDAGQWPLLGLGPPA
jgi:inhibitor of KinA